MKDENTPRKYSFSVNVNFSIVSMFKALQISISETDFIPIKQEEDEFKGFSSMFKFGVDKIQKSYISTKILINL